MRKLVIFSIVGFFAQLIDGGLGMGYGLTSSTLLLTLGVAPAVVSASIHMAEIATTAVSGVSHYRFGNVDKKLLIKLLIPGSISAFLGAAFLSHLPGHLIKPYISCFLMLMGFYVLFRFLFKWKPVTGDNKKINKLSNWYVIPLGTIAGFFDSVGGGGWGPINTPSLLSRKGLSPRKVIGTVDTSEFAVTVFATLGFVIFLGLEQFSWIWVGAFVTGGIIAAPIAAYLIRVIPSYLLGVLVGGFIILTNLWTVLTFVGVGNEVLPILYVVLGIGWIVSIVWSIQNKLRLEKHNENITINS